jgi:hypothetical protein
MDYVEFLIWKAIVLTIAAFIWGLYCGVTGRPLSMAPRDTQQSTTD